MLMQEFEMIKNYDELITVDMLNNKEDRTLLYGYTCERKTFHVYLKDQQIHTIVYSGGYENNQPNYIREINVEYNCDYIPDKRIYPERCDFEFCMLLTMKGKKLLFLAYEEVEKQQYYGLIK